LLLPVNISLAACGVGDGSTSVLSVWMSGDAKYAFVELASADMATVSLAFSGIAMNGSNLRISRPTSQS
jgi:hypothetical protein